MKVNDFLHATAQKLPTQIVVFDELGALTYAELEVEVNAASVTLMQHGIGSGMGVGVIGKNGRGFIAMAFAVIETGAVVMPISHQSSQSEIEEIFNVARLHAVIMDNQVPIKTSSKESYKLSLWNGEWELCFNEDVKRDSVFAKHVPDAALVRFTSGTTGASKGVILSHKAIEERTKAANNVLKLNETDSVMWVLSMAYHFVVSIILYIRYGCSIIINRDLMASTMLEEMDRYNATFLYASPMHIRLLANDRSTRQIGSIRHVISTSTAISGQQCDEFYNRYHIPVSQAYGIIEIGLPVINYKKAAEFPDAIGYAVPGYEVEILNDKGEMLPNGSTGHLAICGPGMFNAYLNPPLMREEILENGWFMTGDLASKSEDGLITVRGRKKSMINVAGNKVFPEEVEGVLLQFPGVAIVRVSAYEHRLLGECVKAELVLKDSGIDEESIRSFCRKHLSSYKIPHIIEIVKEIQMTGSGKLKR